MGLLAIFFFSRTKRKRKISKSAEPLPVTATGSDSFIGKLWRDLGSGFKELKGQYKVRGRRQWHPTPVLLPGKSRGLRSLVGCSPWRRYKSDMTERSPFHFSLSCIGEGNGNSLQCSCLENPRDRGAWWAASMGSHRVGHD